MSGDISLHGRIRAALKRSREPHPDRLADLLIRTLTAEERDGLVRKGLVDAISHEIHLSRMHQLGSASERRERIEAGLDRREAQTQALVQPILDSAHRMMEQEREQAEAVIRKQQQEIAARYCERGIQIGLEMALSERVSVGGEWMMLAACEEHHLRALAEDYVKRSAQQALRGGFYLALANTLHDTGLSRVDDICRKPHLEVSR